MRLCHWFCALLLSSSSHLVRPPRKDIRVLVPELLLYCRQVGGRTAHYMAAFYCRRTAGTSTGSRRAGSFGVGAWEFVNVSQYDAHDKNEYRLLVSAYSRAYLDDASLLVQPAGGGRQSRAAGTRTARYLGQYCSFALQRTPCGAFTTPRSIFRALP